MQYPISDGSPLVTLVTYNTLFGGRAEEGLGNDDSWKAAAPFLKSLNADMYALQECNFWELLGERRLEQARSALGMNTGFLAEANETTAGHRFHTAMFFNARWDIVAKGADRGRYHHVLGWATARLDHRPTPWSFRNLHLDPFSPGNRAREVEPLATLAAPGRLSVLLGDGNLPGIGHPEVDWSRLPKHLHRARVVRDEDGVLRTHQDAADVLEGAGFVDVAHQMDDHRPTGGFESWDIERRQDLVLLSPALAPAIVDYTVHDEPIRQGWSDHGAVSAVLDCRLLPEDRTAAA
ncbi:hypothetical protein ACIBK8_32880 [Streptomyces sp. NPDC050161]|uniref:hypothetical protein n=1 Tax=Streptomyces sp. NPDC050161 TaxID=3365604 RepID=UPI0037980E55